MGAWSWESVTGEVRKKESLGTGHTQPRKQNAQEVFERGLPVVKVRYISQQAFERMYTHESSSYKSSWGYEQHSIHAERVTITHTTILQGKDLI